MKLFGSIKNLFKKNRKQAHQELVSDFNKIFGYQFNDTLLLLEALTHRSYIYANDHRLPSNERLEFLGDSILGLVIAEYLYKLHTDYDEGDLTKTKAILVNEITLARVGIESGLNDLILLSPEEEKSGGRERLSIISDAMEAVIGALYLDSGLEAAARFIDDVIISHSDNLLSDSAQRNYKGELLEYLQSRGEDPPYYEVVSEAGPDHEKTFNVVVRTAGEITGSGSGTSKKEAEQHAAAESMKLLKSREYDETSKED